MKELLQILASPSSVSSHEERFRDTLKLLLEPYVDTLRVDALGNLIVSKKGERSTARKLLLDVHMDENGVMVSGFTAEGFLRFQTVGKVDRRTLIGKRVLLGENAVSGVVGMKPIHLSSRDERKKVPDTDDLYIDIGASDKKEAQSKLSLGDVGHFTTECGEFGSKLWKGRALDSRIPCAVAVKLLRETLPVDLTVVFGAQELVGTRGAYGAAFSERPDVVLCLDAVPSGDGALSDTPQQTKLGKGVVLPVSDSFTLYDRTLFEALRSVAQQEHLSWQMEAKAPSVGNARAYQRSRTGALTVGMAIPVRYLHSPVQLADLEDAEAMLTLTRHYLETFN